MAETIKPPSQSYPSAATLTDLYTVPDLTTAIVSSIVVCNQANQPATFRISHAIAGAADTNAQYLYYDRALPANYSYTITLGKTCGAADVFRVQSSNGRMSFNLYKDEIS